MIQTGDPLGMVELLFLTSLDEYPCHMCETSRRLTG